MCKDKFEFVPIRSKMANDLLQIFHIFFTKNRYFLKFKFLNLQIIPAFPLTRYKSGPSRHPFVYGLYSIVFLYVPK